MIEREMEDLICAYPEEFFPRRELTFVERQRSFPGVGRFDVLFSDHFGNQILMELKAVTAKSGDADQLVRYQQALTAIGYRNVILWLIAPMIPKQTADFLDRYGVEHSEIHDAEFRQVAARHDYSFASEAKALGQPVAELKADGERHSGVSAPFSFPTTGGKTANEDEFLKRCDEEGKWFFSVLFDGQRSMSSKTKITWNHESGFSLLFYFPRLGFVPSVWGFPGSNLDGKPRKQRLEFPFHFAKRRRVPDGFINDFGTALNSVRGLTTGLKPGFAIDELSRTDLERLVKVIFDFAEKASTCRIL